MTVGEQDVQLDCKFEQVLQEPVQATQVWLIPTNPALHVPTHKFPYKFKLMQAVQFWAKFKQVAQSFVESQAKA